MHTPIRPIRPLRKDLIVYWTSTGLIAAVMTFSIISFTFLDRFPFPNGSESAFAHLGLPPYFKVELTIAKFLGVIALVVPSVPHRIREIAYVGFGITLISASVAHFSVGDAATPPLYALYIIDPLFFLAVLIISYRAYHRIRGDSATERALLEAQAVENLLDARRR